MQPAREIVAIFSVQGPHSLVSHPQENRHHRHGYRKGEFAKDHEPQYPIFMELETRHPLPQLPGHPPRDFTQCFERHPHAHLDDRLPNTGNQYRHPYHVFRRDDPGFHQLPGQ